MFCDWLHRFLIWKATQMWCACDNETFRKYTFGLHPQFLAHRFMNCWNSQTDKRHDRFCVHTFALCSQALETLQGHTGPGGHILYLGAMSVVYSVTPLFCRRRHLNTWVSVRLHRTQGWPCPGSRWTSGTGSTPRSSAVAGTLLDKQVLEKAGIREACSAPHGGRHLAKAKLGRSENKKQAVLVRTWGKGHCWWELNRCGH